MNRKQPTREPQSVANWHARRSGHHMTIIGTDTGTGSPVKLTRIAAIGIRAKPPAIVATDHEGREFTLGAS